MSHSRVKPKPFLAGAAIGLKKAGATFDPNADHAGCKICGEVYQSHLDRQVYKNLNMGLLRSEMPNLIQRAYDLRHLWRVKHSKTHNERDVIYLSTCDNAFTPEAAHKLAPLGVIPLDVTPGTEIDDALRTAPRAPVNDVQGT